MKLWYCLFSLILVLSCSRNTQKDTQNFEIKSKLATSLLEKKRNFDKFEFSEEDIPNLDTTVFSSGSHLYWQHNNDSSWLTFENINSKKLVLNSDYIGYWDQLGTSFRKEYDQYLFFIHQWISGCCTMPDFILLNKYTGKEIKRVESANGIFASEEYDFILYFRDSTMNEMVYLDLASNKSFRFDVEEFNLQETASDMRVVNSAEYDLFIDYPKFKKNKVSIVLEHLPKNEKGEYEQDSIVFVKN